MFDIGFLELFVIGIIALIVLGPDRLPKAARTVGLWIGRAKSSFNSIKMEINRELKVQELQQELEAQKAKLEESLPLESLKNNLTETQNDIAAVSQDLEQSLSDKPAAQDKPFSPEKND